MNKKLYVLFGIVMSLFLLNVVQAKDVFHLDFKTKETVLYNLDHVAYQDGYLTFDFDDDEGSTVITKYNKKGEVVKTVEQENYYYYEVKTGGKDIYAIVSYYDVAEDDDYIYIAHLNENFEVVAKKRLAMYVPLPLFLQQGLNILTVKSDSVVVIDFMENGPYAITYTRDLSDSTSKKLSPTTYSKFMPLYNVQGIVEDMNIGEIYDLTGDYKEGYYAFSMSIPTGECTAPNGGYDAEEGDDDELVPVEPRCYKPAIYVYTTDEEKVWSKELLDYEAITEVTFVDEYVVFTGVKYDGSSMDLLIYDMKGNLLQTISSEKGYNNVEATPAGFMVATGYCPINNGLFAINGKVINNDGLRSGLSANLSKTNFGSMCCAIGGAGYINDGGLEGRLKDADGTCKTNRENYYIERKIETKVTSGKGKIEAIKSSRPGEPVTFVITPAEGYVLSVVKVTDSNGKVVTFTDYTFTMPSADVLIEATFVAKNPETKDIAIVTISLIAVISLAVFIKRFKAIKNY